MKNVKTIPIVIYKIEFIGKLNTNILEILVVENKGNKKILKMPDLNKSEIFILWSLAIPTVFFGFYPEPLINTVEVSVNNLIEMYNYNLTLSAAEFNK